MRRPELSQKPNCLPHGFQMVLLLRNQPAYPVVNRVADISQRLTGHRNQDGAQAYSQ